MLMACLDGPTGLQKPTRTCLIISTPIVKREVKDFNNFYSYRYLIAEKTMFEARIIFLKGLQVTG